MLGIAPALSPSTDSDAGVALALQRCIGDEIGRQWPANRPGKNPITTAESLPDVHPAYRGRVPVVEVSHLTSTCWAWDFRASV